MLTAPDRGDTFRRGGLAILGIGTAIFGMGVLIDRVGPGWAVAALLLAVATLYGAFANNPATRRVPFFSGAGLVVVGVLAFAMQRSRGYAIIALLLGLATAAVGFLSERMRNHPPRPLPHFIRRHPQRPR